MTCGIFNPNSAFSFNISSVAELGWGKQAEPEAAWSAMTGRLAGMTARPTADRQDSSASHLPPRCLWLKNSGIQHLKWTVNLCPTLRPPSSLLLLYGCCRKNSEPEMINSWAVAAAGLAGFISSASGWFYRFCFFTFGYLGRVNSLSFNAKF